MERKKKVGKGEARLTGWMSLGVGGRNVKDRRLEGDGSYCWERLLAG